MLSGRKDLAPLEYYNSKMRDYSDNGVTFNAPYGHRWRKNWGGAGGWPLDQLTLIKNQLREKPDSRRCLLQIWDVTKDLVNIDTSKDLACNFAATFRINPATQALDISVHNRSNDMVWGCLGANAVQFSVLLEYMAAQIGVPVGHYHQITDDLHGYDWNWTPEKWLAARPLNGLLLCAECEPDKTKKMIDWDACPKCGKQTYLFGDPEPTYQHFPLVEDPKVFDEEVVRFVDLSPQERVLANWEEPFLKHVAAPMAHVFNLHKSRNYWMAMKNLDLIRASDWRLAAEQWIMKRKLAWEAKEKEAV